MKFSTPDKIIYIIRHGQTEYNRLGLVQGCGIDSNLNDVGRQQADLFFENYKDISFDKIYTSMLQRTHQSVKGFLDLDLPWEKLIGLNEVSWGDKEGREVTKEENDAYYEMLKGWRNGELHLKVANGESPLEVAERQREALEVILSRPQEKNILVCMHGRAMRILLCQLLRQPISDMDDFEHSNLCLYVLHYHYDTHRFTLKIANDTAHLEEMNVSK
ncbi:histidine phosphatase family protein [Bernardetia sp.]|uniref:histidine phosphatase family protein n=1 Tax=Bernardetia sp. TaxID=1937974 RepID=UPI0025C484CA|nr:histidine phosphatase family protein [Bernardetia sp.]